LHIGVALADPTLKFLLVKLGNVDRYGRRRLPYRQLRKHQRRSRDCGEQVQGFSCHLFPTVGNKSPHAARPNLSSRELHYCEKKAVEATQSP
jgi:hypothetical protein